MATTKFQVFKGDSQVFPETKTSYVTDSNDKTLDSILSEKQSKLTSSDTLFQYKIGEAAAVDLKFGGTINIPSGGDGSGQENVIEDIKVNNQSLTVTNKAVNIDLSGYQQKETGKGLSQENFTSELLAKLNSLPTVVSLSSSEIATASTAYNKIHTADTGSVPPIIVFPDGSNTISCPLSKTSSSYYGVYGVGENITQITISSTAIDKIELKITE